MKSFKFVAKFKIFGIVSVLLAATGIVGLVLLPFGTSLFNLDIDFLGGTVLEYDLKVTVDGGVQSDVESIISNITGSAPTLQRSGGTGIVIKTTDINADTRSEINDAILGKYNGAVRTEAKNVTASVGADMRDAAIKSALLACALILIYITIRFEFLSGVAAVVGLIHDVLIMMGAYIILQIPLNTTFIAAVLTILAYSLNSSIVVFDRIRENRRYMPKSGFSDIVDMSLNQTVTRNVNTTLTTLFTVVMIVILGVTSVRNFAIPLAIGLVAGAYSSLFISGPLWSIFKGGNSKKAG